MKRPTIPMMLALLILLWAPGTWGQDEDTASARQGTLVAPGPFVAWAERPSCHGLQPAVLVRWSPATDAEPIYRVERLDGGYAALVDSRTDGLAHLITDDLQHGESYQFRVLAQSDRGSTTASNTFTTYIVDEACHAPSIDVGTLGRFIVWNEPPRCENGQVAVEFHWSASAGATSYRFTKIDPFGVEEVTTGITDLGLTVILSSDELDRNDYYQVEALRDGQVMSAWRGYTVHAFSEVCTDDFQPGPFSFEIDSLTCENGEPLLSYSWTLSADADDVYGFYARGENYGDRNSTRSNPSRQGDTRVSDGKALEIFMTASSASDPSEARRSDNVEGVVVPVNLCSSPTLPESYSRPAVGITATSAILQGQVRPNGALTEAVFEWGLTPAYGQSTTPLPVGDTKHYVQRPGVELQGLTCETTYYYRVVSTSTVGTTFGADQVFTTADCDTLNTPPTITLTEPDGVGDTADPSFLISWTDADPDDNAAVALYHSLDSGCSSPVLIQGGLSEDDPTDLWSWDTTGLAAGQYWIEARIDDGVNPPASDCAGPVSVIGVIFADGFESGDISQWSNGGS